MPVGYNGVVNGLARPFPRNYQLAITEGNLPKLNPDPIVPVL